MAHGIKDEPRELRGSSLGSRCEVRPENLRPAVGAGHTFLDDSKRVIYRDDTLAGDLLAKELRLLLIDRRGRERDVKSTVGKLGEFDSVKLDRFPSTCRVNHARPR